MTTKAKKMLHIKAKDYGVDMGHYDGLDLIVDIYKEDGKIRMRTDNESKN